MGKVRQRVRVSKDKKQKQEQKQIRGFFASLRMTRLSGDAKADSFAALWKDKRMSRDLCGVAAQWKGRIF
jgi:hypothetical protein